MCRDTLKDSEKKIDLHVLEVYTNLYEFCKLKQISRFDLGIEFWDSTHGLNLVGLGLHGIGLQLDAQLMSEQ
jgi:hypothetical protein